MKSNRGFFKPFILIQSRTVLHYAASVMEAFAPREIHGFAAAAMAGLCSTCCVSGRQ